MISRPAHVLALGFGTGLSPYAPGTVGSLLGIPLFVGLFGLPLVMQLTGYALFFVIGWFAIDITGKNLGETDHGAIVWDEIWAMAAILAFCPVSIAWWAAAFVLFRFFDIVKPWPIRQVDEKLPTAFGVMADDVLAAVYTIAIVLAAQWIVNSVWA